MKNVPIEKLYKGGSNWARWKARGTQTDSLDHRTAVHLKGFGSTTWSHRPDWTWTHLNPPETCVQVVRRRVRLDDSGDNDAGEDSPLCSGKSSHIWFVGPIRLWRKSQKVTLTPHWISAALLAAPLRRLTHVYILKRKNFRLVFSVSNPFLTLASINIWIFKAFDSFSPLSCLFDP